MNKIFLFMIAITLVKTTYANDCRDGITTDGALYYMNDATVQSIAIKDYIFVTITKETCSHVFFFDKTDKETYALLLSAKSTGSLVTAFFQSDSHTSDIVWHDEVATHKLRSINIQ